MRERRYWFKKTNPLNWVPTAWQGYAAMLLFMVAVLAGVFYFTKFASRPVQPVYAFLWSLACIAVLIYVMLKTTKPDSFD
jgi:uncharacterized membrane protein YoaK (UPF0700 family)